MLSDQFDRIGVVAVLRSMGVKQLAVAWAGCLRVGVAAATRELRVTRQRTSEGG
jgi:hypothetical protein